MQVVAQWQDLLADIEAQAQAQSEREREAEVAERERVERARIDVSGRFTAAIGDQVQVVLGSAGPVRGQVSAVGPDWILLADPGASHEHLVMVRAVSTITGLNPRSRQEPPSPTRDALNAAWALRRLLRDRSHVRVRTIDGQSQGGVLISVGADHLDLGDEDLGRAGAGAQRVTTVMLEAIACVTRS